MRAGAHPGGREPTWIYFPVGFHFYAAIIAIEVVLAGDGHENRHRRANIEG